MGHDDHLGAPGQERKSVTDLDRGLPADPGIDLVEDEGGDRIHAGEDDLERQHDPRSLAPGRALRE